MANEYTWKRWCLSQELPSVHGGCTFLSTRWHGPGNCSTSPGSTLQPNVANGAAPEVGKSDVETVWCWKHMYTASDSIASRGCSEQKPAAAPPCLGMWRNMWQQPVMKRWSDYSRMLVECKGVSKVASPIHAKAMIFFEEVTESIHDVSRTC